MFRIVTQIITSVISSPILRPNPHLLTYILQTPSVQHAYMCCPYSLFRESIKDDNKKITFP